MYTFTQTQGYIEVYITLLLPTTKLQHNQADLINQQRCRWGQPKSSGDCIIYR